MKSISLALDNRLWSIITIIISIAHPLDAHHKLRAFKMNLCNMVNCNVLLLFAIKFIGLSMHLDYNFRVNANANSIQTGDALATATPMPHSHTRIITIQCMDSDLPPSLSSMQIHPYKTYTANIVFLHETNIAQKFIKCNHFRILI